ncbi:MAG: T9SS type A sorting domain-containing protein, partial [Bacteroidales bacterium]|nr:T9SS type A sorting domain-containing protein [Bacteroidales bacterium]
GYQYEWDNHSPDETFRVSTTGIGFDMQTHWVRVENEETGCYDTAYITIIFSFSECTGIAEDDNDLIIALYPNPNDGKFYLEIDRFNDNLTIEVLNIQGQLIQKRLIEYFGNKTFSGQIDISGYPDGIYLVRLYNNRFLHIRKIIKN